MRSCLVLTCVLFTRSVFGLYCYWNSGCPYNYFGYRTPYNVIRGDIRDSLVKIKDCEPIGIWGLIRHGKRYPKKRDNREDYNISIRDYIIASYKEGNSSLCAQDVENLRDWPLDKNLLNRISGLTEEGILELQGIANRLKHAFPNLFDNLTEGTYSFKPSASKSNLDSAKVFVDGLEIHNLKLEEPTDLNVFDPISPFVTCKKYKKKVFETKEVYHEAEKYLNNTEFIVMKDRIQRRTGVNITLTTEDILLLYSLCCYSWSSIKTLSPWCALFTTEDLKILEYYHDLKHYYRSGYGFPDIDKFGSLTMGDLYESFKAAKDNKGKHITMYFTYSSTLEIVATSLGLYKDENIITAAHRDPKRNWMTSKFSAFSANLMVVLNRCVKNNSVDYNVVFYHNENVLDKICNGGICSWSEFESEMSKFKEIAQNFNFFWKKLCNEEESEIKK